MFAYISIIFVFILSVSHVCYAKTQSLMLEIPSTDGRAVLSGQVDVPKYRKIKGLVYMIPGTGLFDRNVEFGSSGTSHDMLFKSLSTFLNEHGFAVARFDYRGIKCGMQTAPACLSCSTPEEKREHLIKNCIDNNIRITVTPETIRQDIQDTYNLVEKYYPQHPIVVFGHSEGSVHLSYLISQKRIEPQGIVFMGGLAQSPVEAIKWQIVDRSVSYLFAYDFDKDGFVDNSEIEIGHARKLNLLSSLPIEAFYSPEGRWTKDEFSRQLLENYSLIKHDSLSKSDIDPYGSNGIVQASYGWWKMFFTDTTPVIKNLSTYTKKVTYVMGSLDSQTDFDQQKAAIDKYKHLFVIAPKIIKLEQLGHSLGEHELMGPVSSKGKKVILQSILDSIGY